MVPMFYNLSEVGGAAALRGGGSGLCICCHHAMGVVSLVCVSVCICV